MTRSLASSAIKDTLFLDTPLKSNPFEDITETLMAQQVKLLMDKSDNRKPVYSDTSSSSIDDTGSNLFSRRDDTEHQEEHDTELSSSRSTKSDKSKYSNNSATQTLKPSRLYDYISNLSVYGEYVMDQACDILRGVPVVKHWIGPPEEKRATINCLLSQQRTAKSYKEWLEVSQKLDKLLHYDDWKEEKKSNIYDYELITKKLAELKNARLTKDYGKLLYIIRTSWCRNLGNMDDINLYRHCYVGTKRLIEDYIEECETCLTLLSENKLHDIDDNYTLGMLMQTRKNIGRTALVLSGGGCFGLFHIGVLATLLELQLFPKIVSGSSAGGIMAAIICIQTPEELWKLLDTIASMKFEIFTEEDTKDGFLVCLARLLKYGTWFDNNYLQKTMKGFLGDLTFRESYNRTGTILNITVSPASVHEQPTLLNYLTAPNVVIWSAVCASCSLPGIFPSSTIYEKDIREGTIHEWSNPMIKFVDGSVHNDLPVTRLSEMFNVDHIIACQVNPHVVPFLKMSIQCVGGDVENEFSAKLKKTCNSIYELMANEAMHYLEIMAEIGISPNICTKLRQVLAQQYSGDITILPDLRFTELPKLLTNPTPEFIINASIRGARAAWPKVSLIKNHCSIEFSLDTAITKIRARMLTTKIDSLNKIPLVLVPSQKSTYNNTANSKSVNDSTLLKDTVKKYGSFNGMNHSERKQQTRNSRHSITAIVNTKPVANRVIKSALKVNNTSTETSENHLNLSSSRSMNNIHLISGMQNNANFVNNTDQNKISTLRRRKSEIESMNSENSPSKTTRFVDDDEYVSKEVSLPGTVSPFSRRQQSLLFKTRNPKKSFKSNIHSLPITQPSSPKVYKANRPFDFDQVGTDSHARRYSGSGIPRDNENLEEQFMNNNTAIKSINSGLFELNPTPKVLTRRQSVSSLKSNNGTNNNITTVNGVSTGANRALPKTPRSTNIRLVTNNNSNNKNNNKNRKRASTSPNISLDDALLSEDFSNGINSSGSGIFVDGRELTNRMIIGTMDDELSTSTPIFRLNKTNSISNMKEFIHDDNDRDSFYSQNDDTTSIDTSIPTNIDTDGQDMNGQEMDGQEMDGQDINDTGLEESTDDYVNDFDPTDTVEYFDNIEGNNMKVGFSYYDSENHQVVEAEHYDNYITDDSSTDASNSVENNDLYQDLGDDDCIEGSSGDDNTKNNFKNTEIPSHNIQRNLDTNLQDSGSTITLETSDSNMGLNFENDIEGDDDENININLNSEQIRGGGNS
ncbi:hypothetical protein BVG19_g3850 [[Candida] boidinii]|nr:hypothetical protein BVG19_g3850 [[Candida] boidinii]OWB50354.1 hypothetical protein B5S27_g1903 [[Candida] boidinii]